METWYNTGNVLFTVRKAEDKVLVRMHRLSNKGVIKETYRLDPELVIEKVNDGILEFDYKDPYVEPVWTGDNEEDKFGTEVDKTPIENIEFLPAKDTCLVCPVEICEVGVLDL